jgi:hypothetical protein
MREAQDAQTLYEDLGRKIVQLAFLALATHLQIDLRETARQQPKAGGAGTGASTDGPLPLFAEGETA